MEKISPHTSKKLRDLLARPGSYLVPSREPGKRGRKTNTEQTRMVTFHEAIMNGKSPKEAREVVWASIPGADRYSGADLNRQYRRQKKKMPW